MTIQIAREETRCRHMGYSFRLTARFFYMHHPTDRIIHTTACVTPVVEHWLEREALVLRQYTGYTSYIYIISSYVIYI